MYAGAEISILKRHLHLRPHCRIPHSQDLGAASVSPGGRTDRGCGTYMLLLGRVCLCDPTDCGPPGASVHGVLQARIL